MTNQEEYEIRRRAEIEYEVKRDRALNDALDAAIIASVLKSDKSDQRAFVLGLLLTIAYFVMIIVSMCMAVTYQLRWFIWIPTIIYDVLIGRIIGKDNTGAKYVIWILIGILAALIYFICHLS